MKKKLILGLGILFYINTLLAQDSSSLFPIEIDDKWGYIDKSAKIIITPQYISASFFKNGLAIVGVDSNFFLLI